MPFARFVASFLPEGLNPKLCGKTMGDDGSQSHMNSPRYLFKQQRRICFKNMYIKHMTSLSYKMKHPGPLPPLIPWSLRPLVHSDPLPVRWSSFSLVRIPWSHRGSIGLGGKALCPPRTTKSARKRVSFLATKQFQEEHLLLVAS